MAKVLLSDHLTSQASDGLSQASDVTSIWRHKHL